MWSALIDHLKRNNLLPVVAFTFSRAKCDQNAYELTNIDLTTETEKHKIYAFFEECVKTLKEPDRVIPQVVKLKDILLRGIGVHHSGILPILKEIVEMLFQHGLIKVKTTFVQSHREHMVLVFSCCSPRRRSRWA